MEILDDSSPEELQRLLSFLRSTLSLNPNEHASDILNARRRFVSFTGVIEAQLVEVDQDELFQEMRAELESTRQSFWRQDAEAIQSSLNRLANGPFPVISASATRLQDVMAVRDKIMKLAREPFTSEHFFKEFCRTLVSSPSTANEIRESQLRWMRPENNPAYYNAMVAIKANAAGIRDHAPEIFELESNWLNEILEFDSNVELEDEGSNTLLGCALMITIVFLLGALGKVGAWIFGSGILSNG